MPNKKLHLKQLMFSMASLVDLGQEATSSKELNEKMRAALYVVTGMLSVPTAALFLYHSRRKSLELLADKGHKDKTRREVRLSVPTGNVEGFRINEPHLLRELIKSSLYKENDSVFMKLQTKMFVPLFAKDEFVGALALGKKLGGAPYRQSDKEVLRVIAHHLAITLHNARLFLELAKKAAENKKLYENMRRIYHDTIQAFAAAIDAKDEYTNDHSYRVASYAVAIARELGWKKEDVEGIYVAGLLHDIGKIIIDREIINKGATLTAPEINEIKKHPQISYNILSKIKFPWKNVEHFVRHHHERPDGKGYPDALMAPALSDGVKILALADAFDAMTTDRPYRGRLALTEAFREIMKCRGTQFDAKITNTFFNILRKEINGEVKEPQLLPHLQNMDVSEFQSLGSGYERVCRSTDRLHEERSIIISRRNT